MDPTENPFTPGAGSQPPELAGREPILEDARVQVVRAHNGLQARGLVLLGLRGVGKTVLLRRISDAAEHRGLNALFLEAPEGRRIGEMLVPGLRQVLLQLSTKEAAKDLARQGLGILRAFASAFQIKVNETQFRVLPIEGKADSGNIEADLPELFIAVGRAARASSTVVVLLIDEIQYLQPEDLSALIVGFHQISQRNLPLLMFGAGLPQSAAMAGDTKSYAERLFEYRRVGQLVRADAELAIRKPLSRRDVAIEPAALAEILRRTARYPYFLQEWGAQSWNVAARSPITHDDVRVAEAETLRHLDEGFFDMRFDRMTPREKKYVRAMAELGPGPHRAGEVARAMGVSVQSAAPLKHDLIEKGMIYSPQHGDTAFTVPMFDEFMKRKMPEWTSPRRGRQPGHPADRRGR